MFVYSSTGNHISKWRRYVRREYFTAWRSESFEREATTHPIHSELMFFLIIKLFAWKFLNKILFGQRSYIFSVITKFILIMKIFGKKCFNENSFGQISQYFKLLKKYTNNSLSAFQWKVSLFCDNFYCSKPSIIFSIAPEIFVVDVL